MWLFGDCELDTSLFEVRRQGRVAKLEPRAFDVLVYLLEHRDRVVSKGELLDSVWHAEAVSESVLPRCVAAARRAVGDDRTRQAVIQTVHGRGYRFVAAVEEQTPRRSANPPDAHAQSTTRPGARDDPFVGRDAAMARLENALDAALDGHGAAIALVGEPGIGKTRLASELGRRARARDASFRLGRCAEGGAASPFWPWVQVLRACVEDGSDAALAQDAGPGAAEIATLVPELATRLPALAQSPPLDGEQARFRLFDSVARFLTRSARRRPLVVVIDDLHWADADSLRLFEHMLAGIGELPILLAGTYRDIEMRRGDRLSGLLGALARERVERIALAGLDRDAVATLVAEITGRAPEPERLDAVAQMTEGNPFFVHEVAHWLEEALDPGDDVSGWTLPQSVRDAVGRRLDRLSPECIELLRTAAVIGRDFTTPLLERITQHEGEALLELLGEATAAGVIEAQEGIGRHRFAHALTQQTLYEELGIPQRVRAHRVVGEALERATTGSADPPLAELAHHFFVAAAGGDVQRATDACVAAAAQATRLLAHEESARNLARALETLDLSLPVDEPRRCELTLALADSLARAGSRDEARERYRNAAQHARHLARPDWLAAAAVGFRGFGEMGAPADDETRELLAEALDAIGADHPAARARLLSRMTGTDPWSHSMADRERLSVESLALAEATGDRVAITDALTARYWATLGPDRLDEREDVGDRMQSLAREWGDRQLETLAWEVRLGCQLVRGDLVAAGRALDAFAALADEIRQPLFRFLSDVARGSLAMSRGSFDDARASFDRAMRRASQSVPFADVLHTALVFWQERAEGRLTLSRELVSGMSSQLIGRFGGVERLIRAAMALGLAEAGDPGQARREFDALAAEGFERIERDEHWLLTMGALAALAARLGDAERGAQLYALLHPYRDRAISHDLLRCVASSVSSALGALALLLDRTSDAAHHFEHALTREREMRLVPALCWSCIGYASLLEKRNAEGDAERAAALRADALERARAIGLKLPSG